MTEHDDVIDNTINFDDGRNQRLREAARVVEALLFASSEPLHQQDLAKQLDDKIALMDVLEMVRRDYAARGVMLEQKGAFFAFRTAPDLGFLLRREKEVVRKFSKAALETLGFSKMDFNSDRRFAPQQNVSHCTNLVLRTVRNDTGQFR